MLNFFEAELFFEWKLPDLFKVTDEYVVKDFNFVLNGVAGRFSQNVIHNRYLWIVGRYGSNTPYSDVVLNSSFNSQELNPKQYEQVEIKEQIFMLYDFDLRKFWTSKPRNKKIYIDFMNECFGVKANIRQIYGTLREFAHNTKYLRSIKFTSKRNILNFNKGLNDIFREDGGYIGLGVPESMTLEAYYDRLGRSDLLHKVLHGIEDKYKNNEIDGYVCVGFDENEVEMKFDVKNIYRKIEISVEKDKFGLYDNENVLDLLINRIEQT